MACSRRDMLQPREVRHPQDRRDSCSTQKRRVTHDHIKSRIVPIEYLRELDLPVERRERPLGVPPFLEPAVVTVGLSKRARVPAPLRLSLSRAFALEECREDEIAEE